MSDRRHHSSHKASKPSLNRLAGSATTHCMFGCAIGEILGLVISRTAGWGNAASIVIAVILAFVFGYSLTLIPLIRSGMTFKTATSLALVSDTLSITVMEIVDNAVILLIPGAMVTSLDTFHFWGSLAFSLVLAWVAAFLVNRWLISRGRGHARAHAHHQ